MNSNWLLVILFISSVFIWRGIWNLLDKYFLPNNFIISNALSIIIPLIIIVLVTLITNSTLSDTIKYLKDEE